MRALVLSDIHGNIDALQAVEADVLNRGDHFDFVTHLYEFAGGMFEQRRSDALFLRAERLADGTRTFRIVEGEPLETSFGEDVYKQVFADEALIQ